MNVLLDRLHSPIIPLFAHFILFGEELTGFFFPLYKKETLQLQCSAVYTWNGCTARPKHTAQRSWVRCASSAAAHYGGDAAAGRRRRWRGTSPQRRSQTPKAPSSQHHQSPGRVTAVLIWDGAAGFGSRWPLLLLSRRRIGMRSCAAACHTGMTVGVGSSRPSLLN